MSGVYLVTDRRLVGDIVEAVESALEGGVKLVQLREKDLGGKDLLELAKKIRKKTLEFGARLIINDRLDVALLSGADGVHLGQNSFSPKDARKIIGGRRLIGVSTHSLEEAKRAEAEGADLITFGPVYYTASKAPYGEPLGTGLLKEACGKVKIPVYAIGGIKRENVKEAAASGAEGVAVISAILGSSDIKRSAEELTGELRDLKADRK
ncbi:MAG: thiamine phosphate synthase [Deltaproteobacteria bacterium]|nr:thiamine phosphate synthase [Deltaproteobacteria bacterium]